MSYEQAASCPVAGLTAHFLLRDNHVGPDTTLLAYAGAGSVGCFVGGLGKRIGCTSIALVSSEEKAVVARRAGYSFVVEYRQQEPVAAVRELTGGRGADLVLDSVAALRLADRALILDMGNIVFDGTAQEVLDNESLRHEYLAI